MKRSRKRRKFEPVDDRADWNRRLKQQPLITYRTQLLADDVITLIKKLKEDKPRWIVRHVIFDREPTPPEKGLLLRYDFRVEDWTEGHSTRELTQVDQIEGAVISGIHYTTLELRSMLPKWDRAGSFLFKFVVGLLAVMLIARGIDPLLSFVIFLIGLTILFLRLVSYRSRDQSIEILIKKLGAVKIEEEKPKRDGSLRTKRVED